MKSHILHSVLCILLLAGSAWGQSCPPGQPCPLHSSPTQGWRAAMPVLSPTQRPVAMPMMPRRVTAHPAIVRVWCRDKAGIDSYGTGTIFERRGKIAYVLTAAHVLDGSRQISVRVRNTWHGATIKHSDNDWDVAVLSIADPGVSPIKLAEKMPVVGEDIEVGGFASGSYGYRHGKLTQFVGPGRGLPFDWMEVSAASYGGDSGGPMVNTRGRLVGVVSGFPIRGQARTVGCCFPRIRRIIRAVLPPWPNRPGVIVPKPIVVMPSRPMPQPTPAPPPVQPEPPVSVTTSILDYDKLAEAILAKIDLATLKGPKGDKGDTGDAAAASAINVDEMAAKLMAKLYDDEDPLLSLFLGTLPPLYVRKVNTATGEETVEEVFLGEGFTFSMTPHSDLHGSK